MRKKEEEKAELERERARIEEARDYYRRGLLIKYGFVPFARNVERTREAEFQADLLRTKWNTKNGLLWLRKSVAQSKIDEKMRVDRMEYTADFCNRQRLQR